MKNSSKNLWPNLTYHMGFEVVKFSQQLRSSVKMERALRVRYRDGNKQDMAGQHSRLSVTREVNIGS